jgi:hypothetical protein
MPYTTSNNVLARQLAEWITVDPQLERIVPALGLFTRTEDSES